MNNIREPSKEILVRMYVDEEKSMNEIAKDLGLSVGYIFKMIHFYNIEPRHTLTKRSIEKISKANRGNHYRKGKHCSDETKEKLRLSHLGKFKKTTEYGAHEKIGSKGYVKVYCPNHPNSSKCGYVMKHRLVMERHIGRYLNKDEVVHHINGNRLDNRLENLQLMTFKEHAGYHMKARHEKRKEVLTYQ